MLHMKNLIAFCFLLLTIADPLSADGFPFDCRTGHVSVENMRLPLYVEQIEEVSSKGCVTLSKRQRQLLLPFYKDLPNKLRVNSTTHNDGREDFTESPVWCFWTAGDEIAVTLYEKEGKGDFEFEDCKDLNLDGIRISAYAKLYHKGEEITVNEALEVIKKATKGHLSRPDSPPAIMVTKSPPWRQPGSIPKGYGNISTELDEAIEAKWQLLLKKGERLGVNVWQTW